MTKILFKANWSANGRPQEYELWYEDGKDCFGWITLSLTQRAWFLYINNGVGKQMTSITSIRFKNLTEAKAKIQEAFGD
jgi:hypothetical protein